jgi:hypothetical protein
MTIIVIIKDEKPLVKISPIKRRLQRCSAKGKIWISEDFDNPLQEYE